MTQPFDKLDITQFDVSRDRGFLCKYDPATVAMPTELVPLVEAGKWLPEWMATGVVRHYLKDIPEIDVTSFIESASDEQLRNAMDQFATERDWDQFHSPKNLAMALTVDRKRA